MCQTVHLHDLPTNIEELVMDLIHEEDFCDDNLMYEDEFCLLSSNDCDDEVIEGRVRVATQIDPATPPDILPIQVA